MSRSPVRMRASPPAFSSAAASEPITSSASWSSEIADVQPNASKNAGLKLIRRRAGRIWRRKRGSGGRHGSITDEALEAGGRAEHEHAGAVAVHTEGVRHSHWHRSAAAGPEREALVTRLDREVSLE